MVGKRQHNEQFCISDTWFDAWDDSSSLGGAGVAMIPCHGHHELGEKNGVATGELSVFVSPPYDTLSLLFLLLV